jgi:hypothetical protein
MRIAKQSGRLAVALLSWCALLFQPAQARGPTTTEERAKVIEQIRALERDPLNENADATRASLLEWIIEVPEIRFYRCNELLGSGLDNYPYAREFNDQVILSGAAFTLEHQDKMRDEVATYIAGVEGALRMYEALRRSRSDARSAFLDDLIKIRDRGELSDHIAAMANERCSTSNRLLVAAPVGAVFDLVLGALIGWLFAGRRRRRQSDADVALGESRSASLDSTAQWIVFTCVAYWTIVVAALHFLEPDYDPRYRFLSEYQWSGHGWLMYTTFFVLALATLTVALVLRKVHRSVLSAREGFGLLVLGAIGICIAGAFRGFPLHDVGGAIGLPSIAMATLFFAWSFRPHADWQPVFWPSLLIGLAMLTAFLSIVINVGMPGLQQRIFLGLFLLWLVVIAHWLARIRDSAP